MNASEVHCGKIGWLAILGVALAWVPAGAEDWPQWRGPNRDGVWNETAILEKFPADGLKVRWWVPVGPGYSSPVVAQGRVFVTDCVLGPKEKRAAQERVHCLDEASGKTLWTHTYDADYPDFAWPPESDFGGPVSTPVVHGGRVYSAGAVGNLVFLDVQRGEVIWKRDLAKENHIGVDFCRTGSPLIEGDLLIVQTACLKPMAGLVAFDKETGREIWKALDAHGYFSSPLVVAAGGKRQLIALCGRAVTSLDPATGQTYWKEEFAIFRNIPTPVFSQSRLLVNGLMLALESDRPAATVLWPSKKADAYLSDTTTAILAGDLVVSHKSPDRLVCLEAATGKLLWETDQVKSSMHSLTRVGNNLFVFTDKGELIRARIAAEGFQKISRTQLIKPAAKDGTVYSAPSYANGHVFVRSEAEVLRASLSEEP